MDDQDDTKLSSIVSPSIEDAPVKAMAEVYSPELAKAIATTEPLRGFSARSTRVRPLPTFSNIVPLFLLSPHGA